jgi:hypothetical protein
MSESSTRCVIGGNMEEVTGELRHRPVANMEASHRRGAAPAANMRHRVRHGGTLAVKA